MRGGNRDHGVHAKVRARTSRSRPYTHERASLQALIPNTRADPEGPTEDFDASSRKFTRQSYDTGTPEADERAPRELRALRVEGVRNVCKHIEERNPQREKEVSLRFLCQPKKQRIFIRDTKGGKGGRCWTSRICACPSLSRNRHAKFRRPAEGKYLRPLR